MSGRASIAMNPGLTALADFAAEATGFHKDAIAPGALQRVLQEQLAAGLSLSNVLEAVRQRTPQLALAIQQAISVGETYFFRHPEQFEFLMHHVLPASFRAAAEEGRAWKAWSAGCATGEETYSIAACLRAARSMGVLEPEQQASLVGTDLLERNVESARAAVYGRWSLRPAGPELYPLLTARSSDQEKLHVLEEVRKLVRFERHNLLEAPPRGLEQVDLIVCRNVLVYFSADAAVQVVARLAGALRPGGVIMFGPMDLLSEPAGLRRIGPAELQCFQRPTPELQPAPTVAPPAPVAKPAPVRRLVPVPPPPPAAPVTRVPKAAEPEPVAVHLRALGLIDNGLDAEAADCLDQLCRRVPDYIPGLTDLALLLARRGDRAGAAERMRTVLRLSSVLPSETLIAGPEPLPAQFYLSSAEAFLERWERSA